jgi:hypothetical protein
MAIQSNPSTSDASFTAHNTDIQEVRDCEVNVSWRGLDISMMILPRMQFEFSKHVATLAEIS